MMRPTAAAPSPLRSIAALALLVGVSCGGDEVAQPTTTSSPTTSAATTECAAPTYTVEMPEGWHVNEPSEAAPCRWFHPEPFELPQNTEVLGVAIHLRYEAVEFSRISDPDSRVDDILDARETKVDGRDAVRLHTESQGEGLLEAGVEAVSWYVDTGSRTLSAATTGASEGSFEDNVDVLDNMMASLRFTSEPCSSVEQTGLRDLAASVPDPVKRTRQEIFDAARACDYERLGELAEQGDREFTFSFGGGNDAAEFWRTEEAQGDDPLHKLVVLLDMSHGTSDTEGTMQYLWPSAFTYDSWDEVPEREKRELSRLYTAEEMENFERFGSYAGHRIAIASDGEWLFFVAGD
ncbi:MAG: hypothetical protein KY395_01470 [Actinobacteria bacterium]|nr:hypothetical protein [Actinomycetota bacterium]